MTKDFKLSEHFTYTEMIRSDIAIRRNIDNTPNKAQLDNLKLLCNNCLEHVRDKVSNYIARHGLKDSDGLRLKGYIRVTSGFRCFLVNRYAGGSKDSKHMKGEAADIHVEGISIEDLFILIKESGIVFDQLIQEFDGWVHISFRATNNRQQCLRATRDLKGSVVYSGVK